MASSFAGEGERLVGDVEVEVFGHFVAVDHLADPQCDLVLAAQRAARSDGGSGDGGELFFGGGQQVLAFAGPLFGQGGVAAAHQPFAGIVRGGDLGEVVFVEQGQLQRLGLNEGFDLRGAQRSDPVQLGGAQLIADARRGDHAAVPDQADAGQPETLFELVHLHRQGFRVGGVAVEHLDGHRRPGGGGQQSVDDLQPAFDPVAGVSDLAQRAGAALERRRGHVVEHQGALS